MFLREQLGFANMTINRPIILFIFLLFNSVISFGTAIFLPFITLFYKLHYSKILYFEKK